MAHIVSHSDLPLVSHLSTSIPNSHYRIFPKENEKEDIHRFVSVLSRSSLSCLNVAISIASVGSIVRHIGLLFSNLLHPFLSISFSGRLLLLLVHFWLCFRGEFLDEYQISALGMLYTLLNRPKYLPLPKQVHITSFIAAAAEKLFMVCTI